MDYLSQEGDLWLGRAGVSSTGVARLFAHTVFITTRTNAEQQKSEVLSRNEKS
jgi:hypothetical protein